MLFLEVLLLRAVPMRFGYVSRHCWWFSPVFAQSAIDQRRDVLNGSKRRAAALSEQLSALAKAQASLSKEASSLQVSLQQKQRASADARYTADEFFAVGWLSTQRLFC